MKTKRRKPNRKQKAFNVIPETYMNQEEREARKFVFLSNIKHRYEKV